MKNPIGHVNPTVEALQQHPKQNNSIHIAGRVGRFIGGSLLASTAAFGMYHVYENGVGELDDRINFAIGADAQPSDDLANAFDGAVDGATILGAGVLLGTGLRQGYLALKPRANAINEIAFKGRPGNAIKRAVTASTLATFGGMIFGFSANIGDAVGGSQVDALRPLVADFKADTPILTNSGKPELATTPILSNQVVAKLFEVKELGNFDVDIVPIRYSWESVIRQKDIKNDQKEAPKILSVVMSLPSEITDLKDADETCEDIPINASPTLGKIGEKVEMAGTTFEIKGHLDGSGPNVVPIAMNNESYAKCFSANPDQPYNLIALRGDKTEIKKFMDETKLLQSDEASERVYESTLNDFIIETDRTSKNNSNGLILVFAAVSSIATAGALAYKAKSEFANNRDVNSMFAASGMTNKQIKQIALIRSDREALLSSIYAMPLVIGVDYMTAIGTPGAENVSPNALTFLAVLGVSTAIGRIATEISAPSEVHKLNPAARGNQ